MATLIIINNPFDRSDKTVTLVDGGKAIFHYLSDLDEDLEPIVSVNGIITEDFEYILKQNDSLVIIPVPKGGGDGKNPLATVAMIALSVVSGGAAGAMVGATSGLAYTAVRAGIMVLGGLLINQLMPTSQANQKTNSSFENTSPTYSFSKDSNVAQEGSFIPLLVGERRVTPPIKGYYLSSMGEEQRINILFSVCEGVIDNISDIEIDGQSINNYTDVSFEYTTGTENQKPIGNFRDTVNTFDVGINLNKDITETTYRTAGNTVDQLEICMTLDKGLYKIDDDDGDYKNYSINYTIEYKLANEDTWTALPQNFTGIYKTLYRKTIIIKSLKKGQYDVKITRTTSYNSNSLVGNSLLVDYINEVVYDDFSYPGEALLAVNALATDQLEGSFPPVSCIAKNITADGHENKPKNNPAWACYYILKMSGIDDNNIDLSAFEDWADWCEENNYKVSLYIDTQQEVQTILDMLSLIGRATVVQFGSTFAPIINKPLEETTIQTFLFTRANIVNGDFQLDYAPYEERANVVEFTYYDKTDGYKAKTVTVEADNYDATSIETKYSQTLYACDDKETAARLAKLYLNQNRYLSETAIFTAANDSIVCKPGDIIDCGVKYMTNTLAEGRLKESSLDSISEDKKTSSYYVTFDSDIDLIKGQEYEIEIRFDNDRAELFYYTHNKENNLQDILLLNYTLKDELDTNPFSDIENEINCIYAIGTIENKATDKYRVVDIGRASDMTRKITALEYNSTVYNDDVPVRVEEVTILDSVENLKTTETLYKDNNGNIIEILILTWVSHVNDIKKVYINETYIGETKENRFEITRDLIKGMTYTLRVNNSVIKHKYIGKHTPYSVTNIVTTSISGFTTITWDASSDLNFDYYEIEVNGVTYTQKTNSLRVELSTGTYVAKIKVYNKNGANSEYATKIFSVTEPSIRELSEQTYLLEQAFKDGEVTIFVGESANIENATDYDLWRLSPNSLTVGEYRYSSPQLKYLTFKDFEDTAIYKYYQNKTWNICTLEQRLIIEKSLGYVGTQALEDGAYRIFNTTPFPPYSKGDLWLYGDTIRVSTSENKTSFELTEWLDSNDDSLNISPTVDNSQVVKDKDGTTEIVQTGLNTTPTKLGYFDGIRWRAYITAEGKFYFANQNGTSFINYDGNDLTIQGKLIALDGSDTGITTYRQTSQPINPKNGDIWIHTTTNITKRFNGLSWAIIDIATAINSNSTTIDGGKITTNTLRADRLTPSSDISTVWAGGALVSENFNGNVAGNIGNPTAGFRLSSNAAGTSTDPNIYGAYIKGGTLEGTSFNVGDIKVKSQTDPTKTGLISYSTTNNYLVGSDYGFGHMDNRICSDSSQIIIKGSINYILYSWVYGAVPTLKIALQYSLDEGKSWIDIDKKTLTNNRDASIESSAYFSALLSGNIVGKNKKIKFRVVETYKSTASSSNPKYIATAYNQ